MTVRHIFTDRFGGVSRGIYESFNLGLRRGDSETAVRENYRRLAGMIGCGRFVTANQEHTDVVLRVDSSYAKTDIFDPVDYGGKGPRAHSFHRGLRSRSARGRGRDSSGPRGLERHGQGHSGEGRRDDGLSP